MHLAPDQSRECSWSYLNHPAHHPATALLMGFLLPRAKCMSVSTSTGRWQGYRDAVSASSWFLQADSCFTLLALRQVCCLAGTLFHVACNTAAIARVQGTSRSFSFLPLPPSGWVCALDWEQRALGSPHQSKRQLEMDFWSAQCGPMSDSW